MPRFSLPHFSLTRLNGLIIFLMLGGLGLGLFSVLSSASSGQGKRDTLAKFATGGLSKLDLSDAGAPAPPAPFEGPDGKDITLASFKGQTVLVNFWATWCSPCEKEMPSLAALQKARGGKDFQVIAISDDAKDDKDYARERLQKLSGGVLQFYHAPPERWDIVYDSGARRGFPTSILYDKEGNKLAMLEGDADWAGYEALGLIDHILKR